MTGAEFVEALRGCTPEWYALANCRTVPPHVMFPTTPQGAAGAKRICAGCDVQVECLTHALNAGEVHGVWGGRDEVERDQRRRRLLKVSA